MRSMYNLECRASVAASAQAEGRRLDKFFELSDGTFRLDFGGVSLVLRPGAYFYPTSSPPAAPQEPSAFAMIARKHFGGLHLKSFSQFGSDRIFTLLFNEGPSIVFEMFAGGNLFLLDADGKILRPYHFKQTEKKQYKVGQKYEYPKAAPFHFPPSSKEWGALPQDMPLSSSLPKWPIGKIYVLEALARCKISPERKPSDLADAQISQFLQQLSAMVKNQNPAVYFPTGSSVPCEISITSLSSYPADRFDVRSFPDWAEAAQFFFSHPSQAVGASAASQEPPESKKLKTRLAAQQAALAQSESEISELEKKARFVESNLSLIDGRISELNDGAACPALGKNERLDLKTKKYYIRSE